MDNPSWSNDILYLQQVIIVLIVTVIITAICFYISKRADKRRALRLSHADNSTPSGITEEPGETS
jgi:hypothetical protein